MSTPRRTPTDIDRRQLLAQAVPFIEEDIEQIEASFKYRDGRIHDADVLEEVRAKKRWLRRAKAAI